MNELEIKKSIIAQVYDFGIKARTEDISQVDLVVEASKLVVNILDAIQSKADEQAKKAYGDCDVCYGKGYNSYMHTSGEQGVIKAQKIIFQLCKCARGRSLKRVIVSNPIWTDPYESISQEDAK